MVKASQGYDLPAFEKLTDFKVYGEEGPPKGTLYHYPNPHNHQILSMAAQPAPPKIAVQIYTQGDAYQDGRAYPQGREDGADPHLGRRRDRRVHARLTFEIVPIASRSARSARHAAAPDQTATAATKNTTRVENRQARVFRASVTVLSLSR